MDDILQALRLYSLQRQRDRYCIILIWKIIENKSQNSYAEVIEILNNELLKVSDWRMANKLTINLEKSHYMIFQRSRLKDCDKKDVIIQDRIMFHVTSTKFLGVIIDKLKWNLHAVNLDPTIKIQKKIVRPITFSHHLAHMEPIFDTLNI